MRATADKTSEPSSRKLAPGKQPAVQGQDLHPMLRLQRAAGNQTVLGLLRDGVLQRKLAITAPGDIYEQEVERVAAEVTRTAPGPVVQRRCACGGIPGPDGECAACRARRLARQQKPATSTGPAVAPPIVGQVLHSPGQPLDIATRVFFESRFGRDFSQVRVHTDAKASESARIVGALAYTVGNDVVFDSGRYVPHAPEGRRLIAHELAHVLQQSLSSVSLQRACTPAATCAAPISGSAEEFGTSEETVEAEARARRKRMTPARALATGHGGRAHQLELFLEAQTPGLMANIHGIFIDWDMSPNTEAEKQGCGDWITTALPSGTTPPGMVGATKPCVFVHGHSNAEALAFNRTSDATIGGMSREGWRVKTLQTLTHEVEHVVFEGAVHPTPPGITTPTCTRPNIELELTELAAVLSEFPVVFRAVPSGASATDPAQVRLTNWFSSAITNPGESIKGALTKMGCQCECAEVDKFVVDTFNFVASSWTGAEKSKFHTELKKPVWGIHWPLSP